MKEIVRGIIVLAIIGGLSYGGWLIKREINYSFDYEDKVLETITDKYEERITSLEKRVQELQTLEAKNASSL